jgi:hypothetical protein
LEKESLSELLTGQYWIRTRKTWKVEGRPDMRLSQKPQEQLGRGFVSPRDKSNPAKYTDIIVITKAEPSGFSKQE